MNVKIKPIEAPSKPTQTFPFLVRHGESNVVFVVGEKENCYKGYLVNSNSLYNNFQYYSEDWQKKYCEPFYGQVILEQ